MSKKAAHVVAYMTGDSGRTVNNYQDLPAMFVNRRAILG